MTPTQSVRVSFTPNNEATQFRSKIIEVPQEYAPNAFPSVTLIFGKVGKGKAFKIGEKSKYEVNFEGKKIEFGDQDSEHFRDLTFYAWGGG